MKADLENRIADAISANLSSGDLDTLIQEVAAAARDAKVDSQLASTIALDPATRPDAVAVARKKMEEANFKSSRMENASATLIGLKSKAVQREAADVARRDAEALKAEVNQLAIDLQEYDELAKRIAALLERVSVCNAKMFGRNQVERIARKMPISFEVQVDTTWPTLVHGVRLPKFARDDSIRGHLWPKQ